MLSGQDFLEEMIYIYSMQNNSYKRILYFIGVVISITLCIQIYWNYRNYQTGKQQLINEVQISLDNAVDQYYAERAQRRTRISLQTPGEEVRGVRTSFMETQQVLEQDKNNDFVKSDTFLLAENTRLIPANNQQRINVNGSDRIEVIKETGEKNMDSLVGKILVSLKLDTLNTSKLDSLVKTELQRKKIGVDYGLLYFCTHTGEQQVNPSIINEAEFQTTSRSAWLSENSSLTLYFNNETATILRSNMMGLLLSALLMSAVIGCLLFLLKIINNQKQIAEIKNDLISNITHEFKTPISTIRVAMEGIMYFNSGNDPEKAKNYARTSTEQVEKLNHMVEKLLETATLTGNELKMEKEEVYLEPLLESLMDKYRALTTLKTLKFVTERENIKIQADPFHLENAFSNILDNAVKYGGDEIRVDLRSNQENVIISFTDSGKSLSKAETSRIFEKFYRVPKGNTHDVKGFGIGLYYTKQIVERHGGKINVELGEETNFKIYLPYE